MKIRDTNYEIKESKNEDDEDGDESNEEDNSDEIKLSKEQAY